MFTTALAITLLAGLSTGLGGVLVALKGDIGDRFLAGSLGFSAGVMIYISLVELLPESMEALDNDWSAIAAFFFGVALIAVIDRLVPDDINPHEPSTSTAAQATTLRRAGLMTGIAIALHNFPEGFATFMAAYTDPKLAIPIAVAIALHNIPEGVAVAVPLARRRLGHPVRARGTGGRASRLRADLAVPRPADHGLFLRRRRRHHGVHQRRQAHAKRDPDWPSPRLRLLDDGRHGAYGRELAHVGLASKV